MKLKIILILPAILFAGHGDLRASEVVRADAELIAGGFVHLEGPAINKSGAIFFSDNPRKRIHVLKPDGSINIYRDNIIAQGMVLDGNDRLVFCDPVNGKLMRIEPDGQVSVLAEMYEGENLTRLNDVGAGRKDALYFSDNFNAYYLDNRGELSRFGEDFIRGANGVALDAKQKNLYIGDMMLGKVWQFKTDRKGAPKKGQFFVDAPGADGMAVDHKGNVFIAQYGRSNVKVVSAGGKHIADINVGDRRVANCVFMDEKRTELLITAGNRLFKINTKEIV